MNRPRRRLVYPDGRPPRRRYVRSARVGLVALVAAFSVGVTAPAGASVQTQVWRYLFDEAIDSGSDRGLREVVQQGGQDWLAGELARRGMDPCLANLVPPGPLGYVQYLFCGSAAGEPAAEPRYLRFTVTLDGAYLRAAPHLDASVVQQVNAGTPVDVCQVRGDAANDGTVWDLLTGGQYIHDTLVDTPAFDDLSAGLGWCE